jgi:hypothetical protein
MERKSKSGQDVIKAQQKTDEQLLRAPIDGTVQQLQAPWSRSSMTQRSIRSAG